jgi:hypothetical protein
MHEQADEHKGTWIIQRCTQQWSNSDLLYENWPGYCERPMSRSEMIEALRECANRWPQHEFRGHNLLKQEPFSFSAGNLKNILGRPSGSHI